MRRDGWAPLGLGLASVAVVLALVEALIRAGWVNGHVVPLPSAVLGSLGRVIREEGIAGRFLLTAFEALVAGALVGLAGISLGVWLHRHERWRAACVSPLGALAAAPLVVAYQPFLVLFGRGAPTLIAMGFACGLAPTILKTVEGLGATRRVLVDVGRSFNLSRSQEFWKILLPSALPTIFVGLRLGLMFGLINIVGVEYLINTGGLGQLVNELFERYDHPGAYATILFVILISVGLYIATERIERWLRRGT
ncbi:MAG TPA: ABC transporter permease subunit [Candidatus Acidoferrum sp.]|nr:ABC transporter permease subunit [Candidatus Acidoferrum sp.]